MYRLLIFKEMLKRLIYQGLIDMKLKIMPICALLGPRQCGKSTLAKLYAEKFKTVHFFDLENDRHLAQLDDPLMRLEDLKGLIIIDEIQRKPDLFPTLRYLVDHHPEQKYLILGSASEALIKQSSESLAGRIGYVELMPFHLWEELDYKSYLLRGGFPKSYLAQTDAESFEWRQDYIRTFLEKDIPSLGFQISPVLLKRFWMMLTHVHGQILNASTLAINLTLNYKTIQHYIDILEGTFMVRRLSPWFENINKRQVKAPKIYFRDHGILMALLGIANEDQLLSHISLGAIWEGLALEEIITQYKARPTECYFWSIHSGAELDLLIIKDGLKMGFEFKYSSSPKLTHSMRVAMEDLKLDTLTVVIPKGESYKLGPTIQVKSIVP